MKKFFTLISMLCLCAFNAMAAEVTILDKTPEQLVADGTVFLLKVKGEDKFLYGSTAQNTALDDASKASSLDNAVNGFKLEKEGDYYVFRALAPDGSNYTHGWSSMEDKTCFLNSQPNIGGVTFLLGKNQDGQDLSNWIIGEDGSIRNVGNNGYLAGTTVTEEATMKWEFASVTPDPKKEEQEVEILASLKRFVENGIVFSLKTGDQYLFGSDAQNCKLGTYEEATAETAAVTGWKLEYEPLGGRYFLRAITPAGENYTHEWAGGDKTCFLNCQPALTGVTFILGKDQDVKDGSSWIVAEVEGGYTIQNMANKGYLTGLGVSETPVVWQFVTPAPKVPEGCVDVAALTGTFADWATTVVYPKEFAVQGATFGDGDGSNESTHVSVADYDKVTFVVSKGSTQGLALRVWMWNGSSVVTLFAQPEANEATADYSQEYLIKEPGNYVVKFNGLTDLKGVKAQNNWGADPITVDLAYVTPKSGEVTTAIKAVKKAEKKAVKKVLVNNQLVIVKGNDKFNVAGQLVK